MIKYLSGVTVKNVGVVRLSLALFLSIGCISKTDAQIAVTGGTGLAASYTSLTNAGGLFEALNATPQPANNIIVSITGDVLTEAGTYALNANTWASLSMSPSGVRIISGIVDGAPLIDFAGADNVTINGINVGGNNLSIINGSTSAMPYTSTMRFYGDASGNIVTNCSILGSSSSPFFTVAATILFSGGTTTGNDNNTISNNVIGPTGGNLPSKGILAYSGSATVENDNVVISGNQIYDYFSPLDNTSGIYIDLGNENWTVSGNRFYQTAPRTFTAAAARYCGITFNNTDGNITISNNIFGFANAAGSGTTSISGNANEVRGVDIWNARITAPATAVENNLISGINQTTSAGPNGPPFIGVLMGINDGLVNANGNSIGSVDGSSGIVINSSVTTPSWTAIGIYNYGNRNTAVTNNNIGHINIAGPGTSLGFRGIFINTNTGLNATITGNTITHITDAQIGGTFCYAIHCYPANAVISDNIIKNIVTNSNLAGQIVNCGIITYNSTGNNTISRNKVNSLHNNSGTANTNVTGIYSGFPFTTNLVEQNYVHSLSNSNTLSGSTGSCSIEGLTSVNGSALYRNNIVRLGFDSTGAAITRPIRIAGMLESAGPTNNLYNNTFFIGGTGVLTSGVGAPQATTAFTSTSTTSTNRDRLNNIFCNLRSHATPSYVSHNAMGPVQSGANINSNYNNIYAFGTNAQAVSGNTFAYYRTTTGKDANSISADPPFVNAGGSATTGDLHIQSSANVVNKLESAGIAVAGLTNDFDADTRPGPVGSANGGGTAPDIGAYEFDGVPCSTIEISVTGNGQPIADGQAIALPANGTEFPAMALGNSQSRTFTIHNSGSRPLVLDSGYVDNSIWFSLSGIPATIAPASSATCTVTFTPQFTGPVDAIVHIISNDCDEQDFDFAITGCYSYYSVLNQQITQDVSTDNSFNALPCDELFANLAPSGTTPVYGNVTASVTHDATVQYYNGEPYVPTHFDISPANNANSATGTITLFLSQYSFNQYNAARPGTLYDLPTGPADLAGIANLRITQQHGTSLTGLPGSYPGISELINPADGNIVWNPIRSCWQVTFDVTGFSGFFITGNIPAPLPVQQISFWGTNVDGYAKLTWQSAGEDKVESYEAERSDDARVFYPIGKRTASNNNGADYNLPDPNPIGIKAWYRLKVAEQNGSSFYSKVIVLGDNDNAPKAMAYPNPVAQGTAIHISSERQVSKWRLVNSLGQLLNSGSGSGNDNIEIPTNNLPAGIYNVHLETDGGIVVTRITIL